MTAAPSQREDRDRVTLQRRRMLWSGGTLLAAAVLLGMVARHRGIWLDHALPDAVGRLVSPDNLVVRALSSEAGWPHGSYLTALAPVALTIAVVVGELRRHGFRPVFERWPWLLLALAAIPVHYGLRVAFGRPGPEDTGQPVVGAYPSGAALAVALGWGLCLVVVGAYRPRWRAWLSVLAGVVLVLHVIVRVVTDKHWASDIVGSYLLAAAAFLLAGSARPAPFGGSAGGRRPTTGERPPCAGREG